MKIESEIYKSYDLNKERKIELNDEIFKCLNKVEGVLNKGESLEKASKKKLQILKITLGMAAMKTGDTDWESFGLSKEVFENNETFSRSNDFILTVDERKIQKITTEDRESHWNCCRYNFAYNIIYNGMAAPSDQKQEAFSRYFEEFHRSNVTENIAIAATNAKIAKELCESSFGVVGGAENDSLFTAIKILNKFYGDYITSENPELDDRIKLDGMTLTNGMSVFLPEEIKENLGID
ncbi:hypothetical protein [Pectobacterium carotovorum]|uniref:Uncharacterized protein n=1 Tax=Pectobacterium carotovorum TaxID=554 RepID=A0A419AUP8_PECCA|nr:hypothetical protein [Pectobacterium carotovorum]RJL50466.1 hypothetical protein D5071_12820 [Pectobacterium carotovorum]